MDAQNASKFDFSNKTVLVTGGTGALGRSITSAFVASNAKLISSYILDTEVEQLRKENDNISAVQLIKADVTKEEEVEKLVSSTISEHGQIHVLVNVVGGYLGGKSVSELDEKEWDLMIITGVVVGNAQEKTLRANEFLPMLVLR